MNARPDAAAEAAAEHPEGGMLADTLQLPEEQRVKLATDLLRSVEGPPETLDDDEWLAELRERAERVLRGESKGRPWTEVRNALHADLRR